MALFQILQIQPNMAVIGCAASGDLDLVEKTLSDAGHTVVRAVAALTGVTTPGDKGGSLDLKSELATVSAELGSKRATPRRSGKKTVDLGPMAMVVSVDFDRHHTIGSTPQLRQPKQKRTPQKGATTKVNVTSRTGTARGVAGKGIGRAKDGATKSSAKASAKKSSRSEGMTRRRPT
jgi:hypothetical protein